jgi:hypothetical protein
MPTITFFDEVQTLLRALAFADLSTEPEDNPFWKLEEALEGKGLPTQIRWMEYVKGRYGNVFLQAHKDRYEEAFRGEDRDQADRAILKATKYVEKYLAKRLPEAYAEMQAYYTSADFDKQGDGLISQARDIIGAGEIPTQNSCVDRPQVNKEDMAKMLGYSERYVDGLVKKYDAFPRPIRRLPDGMVYFWLDEALAFKAGELYQEIEQERRAKALDAGNSDEGESKRKSPHQRRDKDQSGVSDVLGGLKATPPKRRKAKRAKGRPPKGD